MKTKFSIIIALSIIFFICSCIAIILTVIVPERSVTGSSSDTLPPSAEQSIEVTDDDIQFFENQATDVKFGIEANGNVTNANLKDYAVVKNTKNEVINVTYSNGYICAPNGGYTSGEGYTITLKNGARFTDERIKNRENVVFLIHKDEVFDCEISDTTIELPENEYVSFDGDNKLVLKTNKYKAGDIIKFTRTDNYGESAAIKVVSSVSKGSNTEYTVETPYAEEVFDELDISQNYELSQDNMDINQEGIDELLGVLEEVPAMSDLGYDVIRFMPKISLDVEFKNGGLNLEFEIRFKLNNLWTDNNTAFAKEVVKILKREMGETVDKSLNVYLVFKVEFLNKVDIHQEINLDSGNFLLLTTNTTVTRIKFYLEAEGQIVSIDEDKEAKSDKEDDSDKKSKNNGFCIDKDEYEEISKLLNAITEAYDVRKEVKIATIHTPPAVIGVGVDFYLVFSLGFKGEIGVDHTVTTIQQNGVILAGSETIPIENKSSKTSNTSLYALGIARAEFGLKIDAYVDLCFIFKAGIRMEAGVYAELGGAFAVSWGESAYTENTEDNNITDEIDYQQQVHTAIYFEAGIYLRASVYAEVNMVIAKVDIAYKFLDIESKMFELGNKESFSIVVDGEKTVLMEDGKAELPNIWISRYNIFTGEKSMELVNTSDLIIEYKSDGLTRDENGALIDVSGNVDAQYNIGVGVIDYGFKSLGTGLSSSLFGNSVIEYSGSDGVVADSIEIKLVKIPKDIESFEIGTFGDVSEIELGSSVVLSANNIAPVNATFSDIVFVLKNEVEGVTLIDNVLSVSSETLANQTIVIGAVTVKNRGMQIEAQDIVLTTKEIPLNSISVYPYREDMSEFIGGTIIPIGATVVLAPIPYPNNAKIVDLYYEVKDGMQYLQGVTGNIIADDKIYISESITSNCKVALVAHATNIDGVELISRPLVLEIKVNAIDSFKIYAETSVVHRNEQISVLSTVTPSTAIPDNVEYYMVSGQNLATIDSNGMLSINSNATLGGEIAVKAVADGVESNLLVFTVEEVYAEKIGAVFENTGNNSCNMYYGDTVKIGVNILPVETTDTNYEYEIISGSEAIKVDSFENTITLRYNVDPNISISFRIKKVLDYVDETAIYSDILTINVLTVAVSDFYVLPAIENIVPGEEYQFDFSFSENEIDKNTKDYITNWEYAVVSGGEYASIDSDGILTVSQNIDQFNYTVTVRFTLTTFNGVYEKEFTLTCKIAAADVVITADTQQVATSKQVQLNVQITPLNSYILDISYEIVQGDTYGFVDENGLLTVYDANNVGETIQVRAIVTSLGVDSDTGEERQIVKYSSPYTITIIENPIEYISFVTTTNTLCQGGSFQFVAAVYPEKATYKLINYDIEDTDNCASMDVSTGILRINQNAKVGTVVKVIAYSPFNNSIKAEYEVQVTKAQLVSYGLTYTASANKPLITSGDSVTLNAVNPMPAYYVFEDGEVVYSVVSGAATISGNKLTVNSNLSNSTNTTIKVKAVANGIESELDIEISLLWWSTSPTSVERGENFEVLAQMSGEDGGYTIEYVFADTKEHTSEYGEITNENLVHIYDHIKGGTEITISAVLGNIEVSYTLKVKDLAGVALKSLTDNGGASITPQRDGNYYVTSLLHPSFRMLNNSTDKVQIGVEAYLDEGKSRVASTNSYSWTISKIYNSSYINIDDKVISLTTSAYTNDYATIRINLDEGNLYFDLKVYVFVPAGNLSYTSAQVLGLREGLSDGASLLYVPSSIEKDESKYRAFKKGDSYDFGSYFLPTDYSATLPPSYLTYSASAGTISESGLWQASAGETGGRTLTVTLSSANSFYGRTFASDFSRSFNFEMPNYITTQTQLAALNGQSGEYYLRNDITLSGYWTPIATFFGTFDGGGHTIYNLVFKPVDIASQQYFGLFETIKNTGIVQNLNINGYTFDCEAMCDAIVEFGGIAAINEGKIAYCKTNGNIDLNSKYITSDLGSIAYKNTGSIIKCSSTMTLNSVSGANQICYNNQGNIST